MAPAVGKPLWNPLGEPQSVYPPITQTQVDRISGPTMKRREEEGEVNSPRETPECF